MVPPDSHGVSRAPWYSGYFWVFQDFVYGVVTLYDRTFQTVPLSIQNPVMKSHNPGRNFFPPVWASPRSLAATWGVTIVFLSSGYLDVSVPRVGLNSLCIQLKMAGLQPARFSHSEIRGSKGICPSPRLIAACHVLHRLSVPRHPPNALKTLDPSQPYSHRNKSRKGNKSPKEIDPMTSKTTGQNPSDTLFLETEFPRNRVSSKPRKRALSKTMVLPPQELRHTAQPRFTRKPNRGPSPGKESQYYDPQ